ncbi:hypothetical protein J6590_099578 [Homalodisca vitripennis]|nr:hypothetical protein J6590_099578 [Homalodisca vitripennis]
MLSEFQHERPRRRYTPCKKEKTMTSLVRSEKQPYVDDHRGDDVFNITFKLFSPSKDSRNSPSKKRWYGVRSRLTGQWTGEQTDRERRRDETEVATTPRRRHGSYVKLAAPINQNTPKTSGIVCLAIFSVCLALMCEICKKTVGAASFTPAAPINENTPKTSGMVCLAFV